MKDPRPSRDVVDPYKITANKDIPLNDRKKGEVADVAVQQLRIYQQAADTWPLVEHKHSTEEMPSQLGMCCRFCDRTVYFTHDPDDNEFTYEPAERRAMVVAHVRQCHSDMVSDKGEIIQHEANRAPEVPNVPGRIVPHGLDSSDANRSKYQGGDSRGIEYT